MARVSIDVNGKRREVDADPDTPLLWVLRDRFRLTGTKYGCGMGICGACTVLENGAAVRSCQIEIASAAGKRYQTIEGLSADGSHPCQRAWVAADVAQCGYCQPGMIMEAAALLRNTPHPTVPQIDDALAGHVCRCGTYPRIREAVLAASKGRP